MSRCRNRPTAVASAGCLIAAAKAHVDLAVIGYPAAIDSHWAFLRLEGSRVYAHGPREAEQNCSLQSPHPHRSGSRLPNGAESATLMFGTDVYLKNAC